ncbi:MAG TPA: YbaK/EbsC family protein [Chloroflexia bacterium]|nr:YbaK/EbsC family protein [Chloroflexia bacterium]
MHPHVEAFLAKAGVAYRVHRHSDYPVAIGSPGDFARALGYESDRITKSLFFRCAPSGVYGFAVSAATRKVRLDRLAQHLECRRAYIASPEELSAVIGYPPAGVSPLGVANIPIFMDRALLGYPTVLVGAGVVGVEVELAPSDLQAITGAEVLDLAD